MNPKELEQRYSIGLKAHKEGRLQEAEAIYSAVLKAVPNADAVLTNMAALQYAKGNFDQALKFCDRALKQNPMHLDALVNRASILLALGMKPESRAAYEQLVEIDGQNPNSHYNLANLHYQAGEFEQAEMRFQKACALNPNLFQAWFNLGNLLVERNRPLEALSAFERALAGNPAHVGAHNNLASLLADLGDWRAGMKQVNLGLEINAKAALLWILKGKLLLDVGKFAEALEATESALAIDPSPADAWIQKGNILRDLLRVHEAKSAFERAILIDPNHAGARRNLLNLQAEQVPAWHFSMLADEGRNRAYDKVLRSLVQPGDRVLDIGTGSGLLAMMAARAGAGEVIACEREAAIADVARSIIAKNGYADRVKVHAMDSRLLRLGEEVKGRVDVIVSEILDCALVGEGMLPSIRAALRSLAKEDTRVIPAAATVMVQLVELPESHYFPGLDDVEGFDLQEFERFRQSEGRKTLYLRGDHDYGCSEVVPLRHFNFMNPGKALSEMDPELFTVTFESVANVHIDGLLMWFELALDSNTIRSSGPGGEFEHWGQAFYPIHPAPEPGQPITIQCALHDFGWKFWRVKT